jgi:hypothetical protein
MGQVPIEGRENLQDTPSLLGVEAEAQALIQNLRRAIAH